MKYWFTTQDPKVLNYTEHGIWVLPRFRNSGKEIKRGDIVAIYEVQHDKERTRTDGAKAVVALPRVEKIREKALAGNEGPDENGFLKIAEARLIAKDERGIPAEEILRILKGTNIRGRSIGLILHRDYAGRVQPVDAERFSKIDEYFTEFEPDEDYQKRVQQATPQIPSRTRQKPKYTEQQGHRKLVTRPELAAFCLAQAKYRCEANFEHTTFTSKVSGKNYVEAHHLIPLKYQPKFEFALDNQANIIALCPNCHRLLHHATATEKNIFLRELYNEKRESMLMDMGIEVTVDDVLGYY